MGRRLLTSFVAFALIVLSLPLGAMPALAISPDIVISQVYGGGGNSGATFKNDFIELFNRGGSVVSLTGWSVQYAASGGTFANGGRTNLTGNISPGHYYLIQEAAGTGGTTNLPTPDATGTIAMAATAGKVALVTSTTVLVCGGVAGDCAGQPSIKDFIGYGGANNFEDGTPAPLLTNTTADLRNGSGCVDSDVNGSDFTAGTPNPRNSSSPVHFCAGDIAPAVSSTSPSNGASGVAVASNITITFTEPVNVAAGWYDITCTSGARTATVTGGPTTFTLDPTADFATDESCTVTVFAANVTDQDLIDPPDNMDANYVFSFHTFIPPTPIHTIQGTARTSSFAGHVVPTTGIVTGVKTNGFFIQAPDAEDDSDPNTPEGIFVFTGSALPAAAISGNLVQVTGMVQDFVPSGDPYSPPVTEIAGSPTVVLVSSGNPLPTPITLTSANYDPNGGIAQLVKYEGMRVRITDTLTAVSPSGGTVSETNATSTSNGTFYAVFPGVARPFREPGIETPEPNPPAVDPLETSATHIPTYDANPERVRIDSSGLGTAKLDVTTGATVTNVTGALDYVFRSYSIYLTQPATITQNGITASLPVRLAQPYEFTIASANMERFFDTVNDPESDAVLTTTAFNNRVNKASLVIRNVLHMPDVVGVEEVEHLSTLQAVADKVNNDEIAAGHANPGYVAYLEEGNDVGGIDSGFLVKTSRVTVGSVTQYSKDTLFTNPDGSTAPLNDRPPLVLRGTIQPAVGPAYPILVIVNHMRSLSGINGNTSDAVRIRAKRRAQAEDLANLIQGFQAADPNAHIISVGDYNAFQFNDGYVDGIGTVKGTPTPSDNVTDASPDLVNPDLIDLIDTVPADQRYSFMFDGNAQEIDHILITQNLTTRVVELQYGRNNADFAETYRNDSTRPERLSDHDPIVAYFTFPDQPPTIIAPPDVSTTTGAGATSCGATVTDGTLGTATATDDRPGVVVSRGPVPAGNLFPVGTTTITYTATDSGGNTATATQSVTVMDDTPPQVTAPAPLSRGTGPGSTTPDVFISNADLGSPIASDNCGFVTIAATGIPSGNLFPVGITTVTYTATDGAGNTATAATTVTVFDNTPPTITGAATTSPNANGWYKAPVTIHFTCFDNVLIATCLTDITLSGDGASQSATGTATDTSGNSAEATVAGINIDQTAPTITFTGATTYTAAQTVAIACNAADALSGVDLANAYLCESASGPAYTFGLGSHTLNASVTDRAGNNTTASETFTVLVDASSLCAVTRTLAGKSADSLCAKLAAAAASFGRGNEKAARGQLQAYVNEVNAQRGKAISDANATTLIALAGAL